MTVRRMVKVKWKRCNCGCDSFWELRWTVQWCDSFWELCWAIQWRDSFWELCWTIQWRDSLTFWELCWSIQWRDSFWELCWTGATVSENCVELLTQKFMRNVHRSISPWPLFSSLLVESLSLRAVTWHPCCFRDRRTFHSDDDTNRILVERDFTRVVTFLGYFWSMFSYVDLWQQNIQ